MAQSQSLLKRTIYTLGREPKKSLRRFFIGLGLFAISVLLIVSGYFYWPLLQLPGLIVLPLSLYFAIYGYLGIFANRFAQVISATDLDDTNRDIF